MTFRFFVGVVQLAQSTFQSLAHIAPCQRRRGSPVIPMIELIGYGAALFFQVCDGGCNALASRRGVDLPHTFTQLANLVSQLAQLVFESCPHSALILDSSLLR